MFDIVGMNNKEKEELLNSLLVSPIVNKAYWMAEKAHSGEFRRDGVTPYFNHIQQVILRSSKLSKVEQAVAALHDSLENKRLTIEEIIDAMAPFGDEGEDVVEGVSVITHTLGYDYHGVYIKSIKGFNNGRWVNVKIADILSNFSDSPSKNQMIKYSKALLILLS